MKLQDRARGLLQGANETGRSISSRSVVEEENPRNEETKVAPQEIIQRVDTEGLVKVNDAIEKLNSLICCFSAVTDRLEVEKREIFKIAKDVEKQRIDAGKLLYDLDHAIKTFPSIAAKSIHVSVGATSHTLQEATNGLVTEVRRAISQVFKKEVETLTQASMKAARSADAIVNAKKFIGWQSIGINLLVVMLATLLLVRYVTPRIHSYELTAEEQKHINNGRILEAVWPKLSDKAQQEIKTAAKSRE